MDDIISLKRENSESRLLELSKNLEEVEELKELGDLSIFVAGSYARNEASIFSDIDLFFVLNGSLDGNHSIVTAVILP